jgi:DNA replication protein DnaC
MTHQSEEQQMEFYTRQLRMPAFRKNYSEFATQAAAQNWTHEQYLLQLFELEFEERKERRKQQRLRRAGFPAKKYLQDLVKEELPIDAQKRLPIIQRLDFIKQPRNIVLTGNPGTGKTHLAIALGIKACLEDYTVFFTTVHALVTKIREAKSEKTLRQLESRFEKYDLVICDEFGYVSFDKQAAEMLFTHLSIRAGQKATIITTNLAFDQWNDIFGDQVLTAAMVDRLTHKAFLINMNGLSYRVKESKKMAND